MRGRFDDKRFLNIRFFTFNVHFFGSFKRSVDTQSPVMERMLLVQQKVSQEQFQEHP